MMTQKILIGNLLTYSEQGMEDGVLCIQDLNHIRLSEITSPYGIDSRKVWDIKDTSRIGKTTTPEFLRGESWVDYFDPITKEEDYKISSLYCGEINGDFDADKRLSEKYNFKIKYSIERLNETYGAGNWKRENSLQDVILKDGTKVCFGDSPTTIPQRPYGIPNDAQTRVSVIWDDGITERRKLTKELLFEKWDFEGLKKLNETDYLKVYDRDSEKIICEGQINEIPLKLFSYTLKGHFEQTKDKNADWEMYFNENYNAELHREIK